MAHTLTIVEPIWSMLQNAELQIISSNWPVSGHFGSLSGQNCIWLESISLIIQNSNLRARLIISQEQSWPSGLLLYLINGTKFTNWLFCPDFSTGHIQKLFWVLKMYPKLFPMVHTLNIVNPYFKTLLKSHTLEWSVILFCCSCYQDFIQTAHSWYGMVIHVLDPVISALFTNRCLLVNMMYQYLIVNLYLVCTHLLCDF